MLLRGKDFKIPLRIDLEPYRAVYREDIFESALGEDEVNLREKEVRIYLKQVGRTSHLDYPKQEQEAD